MLKKFTLFALILSYAFCFSQKDVGGHATDSNVIEKEIQRLIDSSNTYYYKGNYVKSMQFNTQFLNKSLEINNPKYITQGYRFLGYDYLSINDSILAKESFEKSEKYAKLTKNDTAIAKSYMDLANLYSSVYNDWAKAFIYHDKSIQLFEKVKDSVELAKAHFNTALTAVSAEDYDRIKRHLTNLEDFKKHQNQANIYGVNNQWGFYYFKKKDFKKADEYFLNNINTFTKEEYPLELYVAYRDYSLSLLEQKRYEEAFEARQQYENIYIETLMKSQDSESKNIAAKYQVEEYKKDVKAAELQNQLQAEIVESKSKLNTFLIIMSILGFGLLLVVFYAFKRRKQLVEKLKFKNKEYLEAKEKSEKLALAKSNFFSTVSHELRTPLYGVIGLSTILLEDKALKNHEKDLKSLKFSADYLLALINDVLQLNKIDSKNIEEDESYVNLRELIDTIVASFNYMSNQHKNKIIIDVDKEIPLILKGHYIRLSQVLMNLVGNASKFTENGVIYISARVTRNEDHKQYIEFSIKDTGIGIAEEKLDKIFDEFSQIELTDYRYQGTGLGLPIVKKLLALSGSQIKVKSEIGKGSTFSFTLNFDKVEKIEVENTEVVLDVGFLSKKEILVVDDNRINQTVTTKILERNGVICTIASNGEEAVALCNETSFDLVLMDLNMPVMDGFKATESIRKFNQKTPIIALTAVEVEEVRNKIFEAGMTDIIVKPYDVSKFTQTILRNMVYNKQVVAKLSDVIAV